MALRHAPIAIAALWLIGCGGSSSKPDAGSGTGGSISGSAGTGGSSTGGNGGGGAAGSGTAGAANPTGSLVFPGQQAALLDFGIPCTNEEGATSDRWCAFFAPSVSMPLNAALFVIDVTKAAAGTAITCSATDPNCLKLTDSFGEDQNHPALFRGDTLVYYDSTTGTPLGWRPGMTAGKLLATLDSDADAVCTPSAKGSAISCLRLLPTAMQTDPTNTVLVDILVGHLEDASTQGLARVDTVIASSSADNPSGITHFQVGFPIPGTETIAWSARPSVSGAEVLKIQTIGNDASRATVASGINSWTASPDGTRWYWLTGVNEGTGVGSLQSAPFPTGTSPTAIAPNVAQFEFPSSGSLLILDTAKVLSFFADPVGAPTTSTALDTGVASFLAFDRKGTVAYVKTITRNTDGSVRATDLFVKKTDGTNACALTSASNAYPFAFAFTANAAGAAWTQRTITSVSTQFTRFSDCMTMTVGSDTVFFTQTIGDRAVLYLDALDSTTGTATAKVRALGPDAALSADAAAVVSAQVGSLWLASSGDPGIVVYSVNGGGNDDGVYVRAFAP